MSFGTGQAAVLKIDNAAGSLVDISAYCTSVSFDRDRAVPEASTFGVGARQYARGLTGAKMTVQGFWDATVIAILDAIWASTNATQSFELGPVGLTAGLIKYTGEVIPMNYPTQITVDGVISFNFDLQVTGVVTATTW
jgi:hypothetical protein